MRLALVPRPTEFYDLFSRAGENALEAARKAETRFREYPNSSVTQADVKAIEHAGDAITRDLIQLLNTQYVTPFDREDIYELATTIDDVVDNIEEACDLLELYRVESPTRHALEQCRILVAAVEQLALALRELRRPSAASPALVRLKAMEDEGDRVVREAIATSVSTRAVSPRLAVLGAAILNFAGAFVSLEVAATVATGIVEAEIITLEVVLAGLVGATVWDLITWYFGLPTSSSHALIGGVSGSALAALGTDVMKWEGLVERVLIPSLAAPLLGFLGAAGLMIAILWTVRRASPGIVSRVFRRLQIVSASFVAFTHGTNDAQKTMGVIALALVSANQLPADFERPPTWVIVSAAAAMGLGTYAGGWRIIRTLGQRVTKLEPPQGFAAETATASILWVTGTVGFPVSTTHTISGSVLGAGATRRLSAVRWGVAGNILVAWVLTIPGAALIGAAMELVTRAPGGATLVFLLMVATAALAFAARTNQTRRLRRLEPSPVAPPP